MHPFSNKQKRVHYVMITAYLTVPESLFEVMLVIGGGAVNMIEGCKTGSQTKHVLRLSNGIPC